MSAAETTREGAGLVRSIPCEVVGATEIAMGHGLVDVGPIYLEDRVGIILHPRTDFIPIGEGGSIGGDPPQFYDPQSGDVVIWLDGPERGTTIIRELQELTPPASPSDEAARLREMRDVEQAAERMVKAGRDMFPNSVPWRDLNFGMREYYRTLARAALGRPA